MNRRLVKLVRDRIGEFLGGDVSITYEPLPEHVHITALRSKLVEECVEYLLDPSLEELADVFEAVRSLAMADLKLDIEHVASAAADKRAERGGFDKGTGMVASLPEDHVQTVARTMAEHVTGREPVDPWEAM